MKANWTYVDGHLLVTLPDGATLVTWAATPPLAGIVDLLNAFPALSRRLLAAWVGVF